MFILDIVILAIGAGLAWLVLRRGFEPLRKGEMMSIPYMALGEALIIMLVAIGVVNSFGEIPAGYRGVVLRFAATTGEVKQPGFFTIVPYVERVVPMSVQVQAYSVDAAAASKDLQNVSTQVTLNYSIDADPKKLVDIYNRLNQDYQERIIAPAIQESTKAATAGFTAEELITRRPEARNRLEDLLRARLESFDIHIAAMSITNFSFSTEFSQAIEAKVVAYQLFLQSQNKLKQVQVEAQQAIAAAHGDAEANRLRRESITPLTVQYDAVQKWDGHLPSVTGSSIPMINLGSLTPSGK
jgi:regulator of protease activity HflC (stomatin/prohibitin superfamily)